MALRTHGLLAVLAALVVGVVPASAAGGCPPSGCIPRTGAWTAPSPQKLTYYGQPTPLRLTVTYRRAGKKVRSTYGNTVESLGVYLRYFCADKSSPWVETGFSLSQPIAIKRDGTVKVDLPADYAHLAHKLILHFKQTTFTGRLSGSATNSMGQVCSTSVSFSGRLKAKG